MKSYRMALPITLDAACAAGADEQTPSKILAGGTDLLGELKEHLHDPARVINLKSIPGLDVIELREGALEIGALVTLTEVASHPEVQKHFPALVDTIGRAATPQLRNVGTLGGNLCQRPRCHYYRDETYHCLKKGGLRCYAQRGENEFHAVFENGVCAIVHPSNTAPVLIAHDARVEIAGPAGTRVRRSLEGFFTPPEQGVGYENVLRPGQILTRVILPLASATRHCSYVEARERQAFDWAQCGATVWLHREGDKITDARVVLSAVAPRPLRRRDLEEALRGRQLDDALIGELGQQAVAPATPLAENHYKLAMLKGVLTRALRQAWKGGAA